MNLLSPFLSHPITNLMFAFFLFFHLLTSYIPHAHTHFLFSSFSLHQATNSMQIITLIYPSLPIFLCTTSSLPPSLLSQPCSHTHLFLIISYAYSPRICMKMVLRCFHATTQRRHEIIVISEIIDHPLRRSSSDDMI